MSRKPLSKSVSRSVLALFLGAAVVLTGLAGAFDTAFAQEEEKKGLFGRIGGVFDSDERKKRKAERKAAKEAEKRKTDAAAALDDEIAGSSRTELISDLKKLKQEQQKRKFKIEEDLAAAKAELARRQSAGEIDPAQVRLTPANIRDSQLSELEKLKAELARRRAAGISKEERIARALDSNELAYRYIDICITRPNGDFRNLFDGQSGLDRIVDEKKAQVYRNEDRTVLLQTSDVTCDVSFVGDDIDDFATGLEHILETQGGIVERKKTAGLTVINTVHPRGNFRLASGRKVIGRGGSTNFYTTITALR